MGREGLKLLLAALAVVALMFIAAAQYLDRYTIVASGGEAARAFRLDKRTGEVVVVFGSGQARRVEIPD